MRCFSYLEDREVLPESATDEFLLGAVTFAADLERKKAQQRTYDAMARKAKAGHVCGGKTFGYDNIDVRDASGQRSHVERRINHIEAAAIRRIFQLSAEGYATSVMAKRLNEEGACPRGPNKGARNPGRRRLFGKFSIANCIAGRSCGRKQPSETSGAGSDRPPGRSPTGFAGPRLHSASSAMTSGGLASAVSGGSLALYAAYGGGPAGGAAGGRKRLQVSADEPGHLWLLARLPQSHGCSPYWLAPIT